MAKYRQIYTKFWSDTFVLELDSQEKLFYLYLLMNTKSTQCGIYELSPRLISLETGYKILYEKYETAGLDVNNIFK
ncbi:hypothetical protein LGL08_05430 [Clostridium estertheticum]|uniref:hypothetical protein n=1 Tax=Clostridium estertheticum TaxID=238834 RepID=UPI001CF2B740|nr:hypothetical protein [Clostridium estertheticum]MCB2306027.1 hypothetical protein [Clostridium estertheticum]MCB2346550.1 hypothetical protein [Clostridium estertheticum]MCB2349002.1 hypothetical protein [Clostridium estertheticum]WAG47642.1 hypothetical protein LL127_09465 [Clostridium estertheticum]